MYSSLLVSNRQSENCTGTPSSIVKSTCVIFESEDSLTAKMSRLCSITIAIVVIFFAQLVTSNAVKARCGENAALHRCANSCIGTCERPDPGLCMIHPQSCKEDCKCLPGYVRESDKSSKCVAIENCPKPSSQSTTDFLGTLECGENEQASNCSNSCIATCWEPDLGLCMIDAQYCGKGCKCQPGYVRETHVSSKCIPVENCPNQCGDNEEISDCANSCIGTCDHPDPGLCMIHPLHCEKGCKCKSGYVRDSNDSSKCVAIADCPKQCGDNEEISDCANSCIGTCDHPDPGLCMIHPLHCKKGCKCQSGYVRESDDSSKCVAVEKC